MCFVQGYTFDKYSYQNRRERISAQKLSSNQTGVFHYSKRILSFFFFKWFLHCVEGFCLLGLRLTVHLEYSLHFSLPLKIILLPIKPYSKLPYFRLISPL